MDFFNLPPALRSNVYTALRQLSLRALSTHSASYTDPPPPPPETLLTLSPTSLNSYTTSLPPTAPQLKHAQTFFASSPPHILFTAAHFRSLPSSAHPEIAFLGRSNVGKSSLLNALFNTTANHTAYVSKRPGKTRTMNGFGIGGTGMGAAPLSGEKEAAWKRFGMGGMVVVDMPGYGGGSREEWGEEALKYLSKRKQLRRTFMLVDTEHGLKQSDLSLLTHLRRSGVAYTIVMSKADKLLHASAKTPGALRLSNKLRELRDVQDRMREKLREAYGDGRDVREDILCCSAEKSLDERSGWRAKLGIDELRFAALSACGLQSDTTGLTRSGNGMSGVLIQEDDSLD
ncbi:hypothetical protein B0A48_10572 [Cryoendolithus antarcticus]|uniref:EngB-type G domain-containing protein n=1 Tax=Cryoendolithus antarcticus TaxID=1507870 RepID=A0A1V8SXY3_9PEZI|nr:hypothetical protein B0A48_10572 [Cryoendolithus antarcticus]